MNCHGNKMIVIKFYNSIKERSTGILLFYIITIFAQCHTLQTVCVEGDCDNGVGIQTTENGSKYEGEFYEARRNGKAQKTRPQALS